MEKIHIQNLKYIKLEIMTKYYTPEHLVNHEHIRNSLIRSFWDGLSYSELKYEEKLEIVAEKFFIGESQIKKVLSNNEYKKALIVTK